MEIKVALPANSYDIIIENDFESLFINHKKTLIITDSNVSKLYAKKLSDRLEKIGVKTSCAEFEAGEKQKKLDTISLLYKECVSAKLDRKSCIIALGGGVCGDMAGFVAATFMRGIDYIQIPTTLLAQCDSSVGGKTGVDFSGFKNIIGAFHQPKLVYINVDVLSTLEKRQLCSAMAEVIKHGIIRDREFLDSIADQKENIKRLDNDVMSALIAKNCSIKADVVSKDEKEQGLRAILNFGHTLGHALESFYNFSYLHGECIAMGCIASLFISKQRNMISVSDFERIKDLFDYFDLIMDFSDMNINEVYTLLLTDKKMENGTLKFILADGLGRAKLVTDVEKSEIIEALTYIRNGRF